MLALGFCLDSGVVFAPGQLNVGPAPLEGATLKNGVLVNSFTLQFYSGGQVVWPSGSSNVPPSLRYDSGYVAAQALLATVAKVVLGLKTAQLYEANFIAGAAFTINPTTNVWSATLSTKTPGCSAVLGTDNAPGSIAAEIGCANVMAEITLYDADGNELAASQTIPVTLTNNVTKGWENIPFNLPPDQMLNWTNITATLGGGATDLDGQVTLNRLGPGTLVATTDLTDTQTGLLLNSGALVAWELYAWPTNTPPVNAFGIVVPVDAAAGTNQVYWVKK